VTNHKYSPHCYNSQERAVLLQQFKIISIVALSRQNEHVATYQKRAGFVETIRTGHRWTQMK